MKKFSKKGVLLFAGAMAVCAFVLPSVASAASWGPIGGADHVLDSVASGPVGFTSTILGGATSSCTSSSFTAVVLSAADVQIRAASFGGLCTLTGPNVGRCTVTATPTRFPWTTTAVTTSNIQIHGLHVDIRLDNPVNGGPCNLAGGDLTITGTLTNARYLGPGHLDLAHGHGLVSHSAIGANSPIQAFGTLSDTNTANRLTVS